MKPWFKHMLCKVCYLPMEVRLEPLNMFSYYYCTNCGQWLGVEHAYSYLKDGEIEKGLGYHPVYYMLEEDEDPPEGQVGFHPVGVEGLDIWRAREQGVVERCVRREPLLARCLAWLV